MKPTRPRAPADRPRDAARTREALLAAARREFTAAGYERATLRRVAADAGVDVALVARYFGSKQGLFAAAVPETFDVMPALAGDRATLGRRLARLVLTKGHDDGFEPTLAMVRSAPHPDAARLLREGLEARFLEPLAAWLGGPDAAARASLVLATLAGLSLARDVLALRPFGAGAGLDALVAWSGDQLQRCIDGVAPDAG